MIKRLGVTSSFDSRRCALSVRSSRAEEFPSVLCLTRAPLECATGQRASFAPFPWRSPGSRARVRAREGEWTTTKMSLLARRTRCPFQPLLPPRHLLTPLWCSGLLFPQHNHPLHLTPPTSDLPPPDTPATRPPCCSSHKGFQSHGEKKKEKRKKKRWTARSVCDGSARMGLWRVRPITCSSVWMYSRAHEGASFCSARLHRPYIGNRRSRFLQATGRDTSQLYCESVVLCLQ